MLEREILNRAFSPFFFEAPEPEFPLLNVSSGENEILIEAEVPGVDPESLDISVVGDTLTIRGERKAEVPEKSVYLRHERPEGSFYRTLSLPFRVDADQIKATSASGLLRITLPRAAEDRPKKISVKAS